MRYERKYRIEQATAREVREVLRVVPGSFHQAYPNRWVNSIYFDGPGFEAMRENLGGISNRIKYRIRWYGEVRQHIQKPVLEKKIKSNQLGTKEHVSLSPIDLTGPFDLSRLLRLEANIGPELQPVILVRYNRTYLESMDRQVRATIDEDLQYFAFIGQRPIWHSPVVDPAVILEVKYGQDQEARMDEILQAIPFRLTKNSKFVSGMGSAW
ncbi:MAG: polyphosphate polymerase domain-containing protein [Bacteroidetes bacterium]|nr:polyphosphate polymerase domain-containing protein [Bacteroidota bacterium]